MRVCAALLLAGVCFSQESASQAVQDEKILELQRRIEAVEATRSIVDVNSNRLTRLEVAADQNRWVIQALVVPVFLLVVKALLDMALSHRKNGIIESDRQGTEARMGRIEERLEKWQG